jgi:hypothetical protein
VTIAPVGVDEKSTRSTIEGGGNNLFRGEPGCPTMDFFGGANFTLLAIICLGGILGSRHFPFFCFLRGSADRSAEVPAEGDMVALQFYGPYNSMVKKGP